MWNPFKKRIAEQNGRKLSLPFVRQLEGIAEVCRRLNSHSQAKPVTERSAVEPVPAAAPVEIVFGLPENKNGFGDEELKAQFRRRLRAAVQRTAGKITDIGADVRLKAIEGQLEIHCAFYGVVPRAAKSDIVIRNAIPD